MDKLSESPLAQQSAVWEAVSPHSPQNREFSAPSTAGDNSSMAVGHVTSAPGNLHSVNPAGQSTGHGSLQCQGTNYTIVDESIPEQAFYLTQGDPLIELVSFPEALQLALSRLFGKFASLRFDSVGLPQVAFRLPGYRLTV